jgi:hypothetical protein
VRRRVGILSSGGGLGLRVPGRPCRPTGGGLTGGHPRRPRRDGDGAAGGETAGAPPSFLYDAEFAGGAFAGPGAWVAWADDPELPQDLVVVEVTGAMPEELPEPASGATVTLHEHGIQVSEGELIAGRQIDTVDNAGAPPHFLFLAPGPDDLTEEQIAVVLDEEMAATDAGADPSFSGLDPNEDLGMGRGRGPSRCEPRSGTCSTWRRG